MKKDRSIDIFILLDVWDLGLTACAHFSTIHQKMIGTELATYIKQAILKENYATPITSACSSTSDHCPFGSDYDSS
jgi:hypothetical protein